MLAKTLVSRALLARTASNVTNNFKQIKRNAGHGVWSYRIPPPLPSRRANTIAQILGGICWWWITWHIATEPEHIYGEWPYIDPITWSDEELGIPPDAAGHLK